MEFFKNLFQRQPKIVRIDVAKRFDLIGRVGQGSMSKVWRARDSKSGRIVALKVLDKEKTARLEQRFQGLKRPTEGEVAVTLQHPHIVRTYEYGWTRQREQFLVMEFVEGFGLSFLVDMQNEQMRSNRLTYMLQLGDAVEYFHERNWIHRDICPRNVIVSPEHEIKLIDFGLVVPNTPDFQKPGNRTGTASYMAPELVKRRKTDQRIDVFSYAATCYEMYSKQFPWEAGASLETAMQRINTPPTDIREHVPDIDEQVADIIMRGLEPNPNDRWPSMTRLLANLREAARRLEPGKHTEAAT
ncbi:MAG: serine/threonine protein kinase [Planctomycetaceae bacterium]